MFAGHMSDKTLVSKLWKEFLELNNEKAINSISK
jgi:hypothetical protein